MTMKSSSSFEEETHYSIESQAQDKEFQALSEKWMSSSIKNKYSYHFSWLGRPIIQYPQDIIAVQEIIWNVKPDLIIEAGIAHGGSLIFNASMLELNAACGGPQDAEVLGIDIDIRAHNRKFIEEHPMFRRISMIEGSSIAPDIIEKVHEKAATKKRILISLDSNHTHDHVLAELEAYAPLTTVGSYCIVFDTIIEQVFEQPPKDRPWCRGNNPKTAIQEYLKSHPEFEVENQIDNKLLISATPGGYLKRIK